MFNPRLERKWNNFDTWYLSNAEPFRVNAPIMGEIITRLQEEIQTTQTQIGGGRDITRAEETEIQELVELKKKTKW